MILNKYGVGQDPYCYAGTSILRNLIGLRDETLLSHAERELSAVAANGIIFEPPPYSLETLARIHYRLFKDVYGWAGQPRTVDISKGTTHFCTVPRIEPEARKLFISMEQACWFEGLERNMLVAAAAQSFGDLNAIHPFREGNGRALRLLFEHIVVNAGFSIDWWAVNEKEWLQANIDSVVCDYRGLSAIFERCVGGRLTN